MAIGKLGKNSHTYCDLLLVLQRERFIDSGSMRGTKDTSNAASEDRTHDLGIMRPTRYQLRYSRLIP